AISRKSAVYVSLPRHSGIIVTHATHADRLSERGNTMKVALGTLELDEDTRKKLGKATIGSSYLKRDQARDWALGLINGELDKIRAGSPAVPAPVQSNGDSQPEYLPEPPTAPK